MNDITQPLILARGSHDAGTGKACAMNIVSWEQGDVEITDYPACSDPMLSSVVQNVNDILADVDGLLHAPWSLKVLDLGHQTVGTSGHGLTSSELNLVYLRVAINTVRPAAVRSSEIAVLDAAAQWVECPCAKHSMAVKRTAAEAYEDSWLSAALIVGDVVEGVAEHTWLVNQDTADAISYLLSTTRDEAQRIAFAQAAISEFKRLTGVGDVETPAAVTTAAYEKSLVRA